MKRLSNNKGISLIEILVALAILALIMTAVISLMINNNIIFRKTKNDLKVQTQADETFNLMSDVLMSSKYIYVEGYTANAEQTFSKSEIGATATSTFTAAKARTKVEGAASTGTKFISDDDYKLKDIYVKKLVVVAAVPIDSNVINLGTISTYTEGGATGNYYVLPAGLNYSSKTYTIGSLSIDDQDAGINCKNDLPTTDFSTTGTHNILVGDCDRCIYTFIFDKNDIYMTKQYMYQTSLNSTMPTNINDPSTWTDEQKQSLKISNSLNYVVNSDGSTIYPGFVMRFDPEKNGVGLRMYFNDSHMSYTVENMVKVHNSSVISGYVEAN